LRSYLVTLALIPAALFSRAETAMEFRVYTTPGGAPVAPVNGMLADRDGAVDPRPTKQVREGVLAPAVAKLPEAGIGSGYRFHAELQQPRH